jgi:hypothetical protein
MTLRNQSLTLIYLTIVVAVAVVVRAGFIADGTAVCTSSGSQHDHCIAGDGAGGAIVVWADERSGVDNPDIYAQRITLSGGMLWQDNGEPICAAAGYQLSPQIIRDGPGGALIVWEDRRSGNSDIYGQRIDSNGAPQWEADGVSICIAAGARISPRIVPDGSGGVIVAWEDRRSGGNNRDIYVQRVGASGNALGLRTVLPSARMRARSSTPRSYRTAPAGLSSRGRIAAAAETTVTSTPRGSIHRARFSGLSTAPASARPRGSRRFPRSLPTEQAERSSRGSTAAR